MITTKPKLSTTKIIIEHFRAYSDQEQFRFTITSKNDKLLSFWEPNAPNYEDRLASLKYAYQMNFKTSISIEPFVDFDPQPLILALAPYVTESIWLGLMNYIPKQGLKTGDGPLYAEIRKNYEIEHLYEIYTNLIDFPLIRFKDSMTNRLEISNYI